MTHEELSFELDDILEDINIGKDGIATNDEKVMEENIIYILKREKLWKKGYLICFPSGASGYGLDVGNTDDDPSTYQYCFEIFSDMNTVVATGEVNGQLMVFRKSDDPENDDYNETASVEVVDMNMVIADYMPKFLTKNDKEVVCFD